ncbi:response regulator [Flavobacteriaceae bacterium]|nr:response regulator [Flavobacteriaceae bacterium]
MIEKLKVLVIEDNFIEVMKFKKAIQKIGIAIDLFEASNGQIAIDKLTNKEVSPDLILLDLNMPDVNGIEFLKLIKANDSLRHIPMVILTTSSNPEDVQQCFALGVSGYVLKPLKYEDYVDRIKKTLEYWQVNNLLEL